MLVFHSRCTLPHWCTSEVRRKTKLMEERFAGLLVTASAELGKLGVPVDGVMLYLTSLKASTQADVPLFDLYTLSLLNESSLNRIFTILSRTGDVNFLNSQISSMSGQVKLHMALFQSMSCSLSSSIENGQKLPSPSLQIWSSFLLENFN